MHVQYLGIPFMAYFWVGLAYSYLEPGGLPRSWNLFLSGMAVTMLLIAQTQLDHSLYYAHLDYVRVGGLAIAHRRKGVLYWWMIAYLNVWTATGVLLLFRAWHQSIPLYRRQAFMLLAGSLLPWGFHLLYQAGWAPEGIDIAPFGIAGAGMVFAIAAMRHRALNVLPLARDLVLDSIAEGVVVLDLRRRIIDFNRAATVLLPGLDLRLIGHDCSLLLDPDQDGLVTPAGAGARQLEVRRNVLRDRRGLAVGTVLLIQDMTEKMAMIDALRQLATTDSLTGCDNRRHLFERCQQAVRAARRYRRPLSLIILDIDDFKQINDREGHPAGDALLRRVAAVLQGGLREADALGRYGGDEFIIVLPETTGPAALASARHLAGACAAECGVRLSLGVAELQPGGEGYDELLTRADQALYRAKSAGKGRAALAGAADDAPAV